MKLEVFNMACYTSFEDAEKNGAVYSADLPDGFEDAFKVNLQVITVTTKVIQICLQDAITVAWRLV